MKRKPLTILEREIIEDGLNAKKSITEIAAEIKSTNNMINIEIRKGGGIRVYNAIQGQKLAEESAERVKKQREEFLSKGRKKVGEYHAKINELEKELKKYKDKYDKKDK
jgi:IS30 family transposase